MSAKLRGKQMASRHLQMADAKPKIKPSRRLPDWFRTRLPNGEQQQIFKKTKASVKDNKLHTVCEEARCPNIHECWSNGDATFMIAGQECTRGCRFCAVGTIKNPPALDPNEPTHLADAVETMNLRHLVITVVNRDDLEDSGAKHYKDCIDEVHKRLPNLTLELLCSDLAGDLDDLYTLLEDSPLNVFAHNVECVPRLDKYVRDARASFAQSILILKQAKSIRPDIITKTSLMVGLGETDEEISEALELIREANVDLVTIGQYLAPSEKHLKVDRYPEPEMYDTWAKEAIQLGFSGIASGPLVRSSYKAGLLYRKTSNPKNKETIPGAYVMVRNLENKNRHTLNRIPREVA